MKKIVRKKTDVPFQEDEPSFEELMKQTDGGGDNPQPPPAVHVWAPRLKARYAPGSPDINTNTINDEFMRNGLQHREMRQLKKGKFHVDDNSKIDLHGLRRNDAHRALTDFLDRCLSRGVRHAVIICGKGYHSPHGKPVLKSLIRSWLMDYDKVLAYSPALQKHGGTGALYILLGKRHGGTSRYD